jgi:hypothetical protein
VCPECLAHSHPHSACTWSWDSVLAVTESGSSKVRCMRGHRVDSNLVCGTSKEPAKLAPIESALGHAKPVSELLPSVVLVGVWDAQTKTIINVGSGFVADRKLGLIVTAGHVCFQMEAGRQFGSPYFGRSDAKVVIGVVSDDKTKALFRYFAEIVADDIQSVDACILRIQTRLRNDVDDPRDELEIPIEPSALPSEKLCSLKLTSRFDLEESVRILGFNQGGEGVLERGRHLNRSFDFARGYVCSLFEATLSDDSSNSSEESPSQFMFIPREEIVVMCPTISGHSGGPCVNEEGKVIGILSRADSVDRQRCYLVPSTEIKILLNKARKLLTLSAISTVLHK